MNLTNAAAIVTGGAGGFGPATVRRLAQMGARVVISQPRLPQEWLEVPVDDVVRIDRPIALWRLDLDHQTIR